MKKILILDDDPDFAELMKTRLEANNYDITTASGGKDFFEKISNDLPDIILVDILMPDINGYQVCEALKDSKSTAGIPVIILTGQDLEHDGIVNRCLKIGVEAFLSKPVDTQELLTTIERLLQK